MAGQGGGRRRGAAGGGVGGGAGGGERGRGHVARPQLGRLARGLGVHDGRGGCGLLVDDAQQRERPPRDRRDGAAFVAVCGLSPCRRRATRGEWVASGAVGQAGGQAALPRVWGHPRAEGAHARPLPAGATLAGPRPPCRSAKRGHRAEQTAAGRGIERRHRGGRDGGTQRSGWRRGRGHGRRRIEHSPVEGSAARRCAVARSDLRSGSDACVCAGGALWLDPSTCCQCARGGQCTEGGEGAGGGRGEGGEGGGGGEGQGREGGADQGQEGRQCLGQVGEGRGSQGGEAARRDRVRAEEGGGQGAEGSQAADGGGEQGQEAHRARPVAEAAHGCGAHAWRGSVDAESARRRRRAPACLDSHGRDRRQRTARVRWGGRFGCAAPRNCRAQGWVQLHARAFRVHAAVSRAHDAAAALVESACAAALRRRCDGCDARDDAAYREGGSIYHPIPDVGHSDREHAQRGGRRPAALEQRTLPVNHRELTDHS